MYNAPYSKVADQLAKFGRYGDSELVHLNPIEVQMLASLSPTGQLTTNPMTGRKEAFLPFLAPLLGSFLGNAFLGSTLGATAAGALGAGAATTLATGDLEQGILSGITGFGIGSALGGLGSAAKAATDTATQAATQAATTFSPAAAAATMNPLATETALQSAIQSAPSAFSPGMAGAQMAAAPNFANVVASPAVTPPPQPTFMQNLAQPFQQPGEFFSQLSQPGSFLPIYVGETGRMARQAELSGQGSMKEYEEEQEAQRKKTLGQMSNVFNQIRQAYPGVGYYQGGMVEKYANGGSIEDQIRDAILGSQNFDMPSAENVQLSLRGPRFVPPPASSYSALDVGGEGYLAGVAPEFQYFRDMLPEENASVVGPGQGAPIAGGGTGPAAGGGAGPISGGGLPGGTPVYGGGDYSGTGPIDLYGDVNAGVSSGGGAFIPPPTFTMNPEEPSGYNQPFTQPYLNYYNPETDTTGAGPMVDIGQLPPSFTPDMQLPSMPPLLFDNVPMYGRPVEDTSPPPLSYQPAISYSGGADYLSPFSEEFDSGRPEFTMDAMYGGGYMRYQDGGEVSLNNTNSDPQSIVEMTIAAIRGEVENADQIIRSFVEMYGPEVFMQLREQVLQQIVPGAQTNGMVQGQGGGQDDLVQGMIGSQRPVAVSPGEYIIPADVVSLAGGGYSGDGAKFFDGLIDDIRQKTMGTTEQIRPYQRNA